MEKTMINNKNLNSVGSNGTDSLTLGGVEKSKGGKKKQSVKKPTPVVVGEGLKRPLLYDESFIDSVTVHETVESDDNSELFFRKTLRRLNLKVYHLSDFIHFGSSSIHDHLLGGHLYTVEEVRSVLKENILFHDKPFEDKVSQTNVTHFYIERSR